MGDGVIYSFLSLNLLKWPWQNKNLEHFCMDIQSITNFQEFL